MPYGADAIDRRDPRTIAMALPILEWIAARYQRLTCEGRENVPIGKPVMFVGNHNGGILGPDLMCTLTVLWRILGAESPLYPLAHDFVMRQLPAVGHVLQRFGAVAASRDNAARVLASGGQVLVYPGGDLDAYRHFRRRNEIVILPRTGFVEVAQAARVPIVPIVSYGAHRSAYIFHEGERIAEFLRMRNWARLERFPLALALPWGLTLGPWLPYLPLPFPVGLRILPPIVISPDEPPLDAATRIQREMQTHLDDMAS